MEQMIAKAQKWWWLVVTVPTMFTMIGGAYVMWDKIDRLVVLAFDEDSNGLTGLEKFDLMWADWEQENMQ